MAQTQLKRHPWRAAVWGLILGLGVFVYLTFVWPVIGLDDVNAVAIKGALVVGGVMLLAILWGLFGPARKPKGAAPGRRRPAGVPRRPRPPARRGVSELQPLPETSISTPPSPLDQAGREPRHL